MTNWHDEEEGVESVKDYYLVARCIKPDNHVLHKDNKRLVKKGVIFVLRGPAS
jgi:hypothetical protein